VRRSTRGVLSEFVPAFVLEVVRKTTKTSVRVVGVPAEIFPLT